ncbi:hypothetical protein HYV73_00530 [Candidatus Uhrbacteria bacterium]|nr:hypothetical protein [Candidatus Uhrbacteria bacterium]
MPLPFLLLRRLCPLRLLRLDFMPSALEKSILRTLAWFSVLEYPATTFEVWKWLHAPPSYVTLLQVGECLRSSPFVIEKTEWTHGFVTLNGASDLLTRRHARFLSSMKKWHRLSWVCCLARHIPWVKGVAAANTLSYFSAGEKSDIDIFVIVRRGAVWLTRLLLVTPFALLRLRPGTGKEHPFCFSFFTSDTSLGLANLRFVPSEPYLPFWIRSLVPVLEREAVFSSFHEANQWAARSFPNAFGKAIRPVLDRRAGWSLWFPGWMEGLARWFQQKRFPSAVRSLQNIDTRVVVNESMIKLHETDARADFARRFFVLCQKLEATP